MRLGTRLLAALTLTAGLDAAGSAQTPRLEDLLARKPVQPVTVSTPAAAELAACRVERGSYPAPATGYVVRDGRGLLLRQFIDSTGRGTPNLAYFYHEGVEAYREIDANGNGKPDQFRWLGVNGGKWGADADEDGAIDGWYLLSPQELSQEVFAALQAKDMRRIEALLLTAKEAQSLGLPPADADALTRRAAAAAARAKATAEALALTDKSRWIHVELGLPYAVAADSFGGRDDLVKQPAALVLYDKGDGKADVFTVGEMVQAGKVWRLIDGPVPGVQPTLPSDATGGSVAVIPPEAQPLLAKLQAVKPAADPADLPRYHRERAVILEQIVGMTKGDDQVPWLKQVIDAYAAAAEANPSQGGALLSRLKEWAAIIAKDAPGRAADDYAAYRTAGVEYTLRMATAKEGQVGEVQKWWRGQLADYVARHPNADDAPEALMRLADSHEFTGRDGEAAARQAYEQVAAKYPRHPSAARAQGAVRRLTSEGQPFQLPPATTLDGKPFDFALTAGKPTLVIYFKNWSRSPAAEDRVVADLKNYAELARAFGDKINLVSVSLDDDPAHAAATVAAAALPSANLHLPGGHDRSPLAVAYGIPPTDLYAFLLDKQGKVADKNAQYGTGLKEQIEKLLK